MVLAGGLVRERTAGPDLFEQRSILQAGPRLCLDLLKLQLGTQAHLVVVVNGLVLVDKGMGVVRGVVGGHAMSGQQRISQGQRLPALRINDQELFFDAECTHSAILRQAPSF